MNGLYSFKPKSSLIYLKDSPIWTNSEKKGKTESPKSKNQFCFWELLSYDCNFKNGDNTNVISDILALASISGGPGRRPFESDIKGGKICLAPLVFWQH